MKGRLDSKKIGAIKVRALRVIVWAAMALTVLLTVFVPRIIDNYLFYVQNVADQSLAAAMAAYVYLSCLPFLVALFTVKRLCDVIASGEPFSTKSLKELSVIVWCCYAEAGVSLIAIAAFAVFYNVSIYTVSLFMIGVSGAVAIFATVLKELVKSAIRLREENELTV